jgi:hypothetical protein
MDEPVDERGLGYWHKSLGRPSGVHDKNGEKRMDARPWTDGRIVDARELLWLLVLPAWAGSERLAAVQRSD